MPTVTTPIGTGQSGGLGVGAATPQAWYNLLNSLNLVAADQIQQGAILNQEFSVAGLILDGTAFGINTDSTHYVELTTAAGAAWNDNAAKRTNPYYYDGTKGAAVRNNTGGNCMHLAGCNFLRLTNLQIRGDQEVITFDAATSYILTNCIIQCGDIYLGAGANVTMNNCLIVSVTPRFNRIFLLEGSNTLALNSCDIVAPNGVSVTNILDGSGAASTLNYKNCALFGTTTLGTGAGSMTITYDHCASSLTIPSGTANQSGLSYIAQFRNYANDFAVASSSVLLNGTPIAGFPNDATGILRNATTPNIGPWEFAAASGGGSPGGFVKFGPFLGIAVAEEWLRRRKEQVRRDEG